MQQECQISVWQKIKNCEMIKVMHGKIESIKSIDTFK